MNIFDSIFDLSARAAERGLTAMGNTLGGVQKAVEKATGLASPELLKSAPLDGPPDIDAATAELGNRLLRVALRASRNPDDPKSASREALAAFRASFSYVDRKKPRSWIGLPFQLPLSFGTLMTQEGLRLLHAASALGPRRASSFLGYMVEPFADFHVYVSLQYQDEIRELRKRLEKNPNDAETRHTLGRTLTKCGLYKAGADELAIAAADPKVEIPARYDRSIALCRAGLYREAIEEGVAVLNLDPEHELARYWTFLAAQRLGGYPDSVPPESRMNMKVGYGKPTSVLEDVAAKIGLDKTSGGRGTAILDITGDGTLDVVIAAAHAGISVYRNNGDGTFTDASVGSGLDECVNGFVVTAGDYDNDGKVDLYVTRLGFYAGESALYRNNGNGTFTNVTKEAGIGCYGPGFTASWADYDNDGRLDLFVANNLGGLFDRKTPNRLFHNNGDGTFTERAAAAGLLTDTPTTGHAWGDYDNDGRLDLFLSSGNGRPQLFHNNGDGTFTDVSREAGIDEPCFGSVAFWMDYDNDGWLDLVQYVWSVQEDMLFTMQNGYGPPEGRPIRIYHNNRNGTFTLVNDELGISECWGTMSGNFGDMNNDGRQDLLLGNGSPQMERNEPAILLEAGEGGRYRNVTFAAGMPFEGKTHGVNFADLDGDGRISIILAHGGAYPGDLITTAVFRPKTLPGNFLNVRLVGTGKSNRDAIGARLSLEHEGKSQHLMVSGGSNFGCLPFEQHFGLGERTRAGTLKIRWPSGQVQEISNLPINETIRITEGRDGWEDVYEARKKNTKGSKGPRP